MSVAQIVGALLVTAPFVALFAFMARELGVLETLGVFASVAALTGIILLGSYLLVVPR